MSSHEFFKDFGYKPIKRKISKYMSEEMESNLFIMEIYNNWDHVKQLMKDYKDGKLANKRLDGLDQNWISNLMQNNIDLELFNTSDEFYEKYIR